MAKVFFKIKEKFVISNSLVEGVSPVATQFKEKNPQMLNLSLMRNDEPGLGFSPYEVNSGHFNILLLNDKIEVQCDAIFKINVKPEYMDVLLNPNAKWECSGLGQISGELSGLETEKYQYKNRFGEGEAIRHLIAVKVGLKEKDLK